MPFALLALALAAQVAAPQQPLAIVPVAQPPATMVVEPAAMMIAACDANGDAIVTRDEMHLCLAHSFDSIDTAHKGSIGYIDYSDWALKWLGDANAVPGPYAVDTDNDNRITLAELQARFDAIFDRLDTDKDGKLTRAELLTIRANPCGTGDDRRHRHR
jgi:hypothetical protein